MVRRICLPLKCVTIMIPVTCPYLPPRELLATQNCDGDTGRFGGKVRLEVFEDKDGPKVEGLVSTNLLRRRVRGTGLRNLASASLKMHRCR